MNNLQYRGSPKHKRRPSRGRKGTFCPEWTHATPAGGLGKDPHKHDWPNSLAQEIFELSELDPKSGKRYATMKGIAFAAQRTGEGTWHGYPEPWNKIPAELKAKWQDEGKVTTSNLKRYKDFPKDNVEWALDSENE